MITYDEGIRDGESITYTRRGEVLKKAEYSNNRLDGDFILYNERTREVEQHFVYKNGQVVKVKVGKHFDKR
jgi:antitoxin component YwqK of YwqJK toxin-antitoxin module